MQEVVQDEARVVKARIQCDEKSDTKGRYEIRETPVMMRTLGKVVLDRLQSQKRKIRIEQHLRQLLGQCVRPLFH